MDQHHIRSDNKLITTNSRHCQIETFYRQFYCVSVSNLTYAGGSNFSSPEFLLSQMGHGVLVMGRMYGFGH